MSEAVALDHIGKRYGATVALDDVTLAVGSGAFAAVLGPSGCGKSTLLHVIDGLVTPDSGTVRIDGQVIPTRTAPEKRGIGVMFQDATLFPHMNVFENVAFPLRVRDTGDDDVKKAVDEILALTGLTEQASRKPSELSGGQQQRVALSRALVFKPSVVLLDEPLSSLDRPLRESMQRELKRIQRVTGSTFIMVTHDRDEAMGLANVIFVMRDGRIEQSGSPAELYRTPRNRFVAEFFGASTVIEGDVIGGRDEWSVVAHGLVLHRADGSSPESKRIAVAIRPENVQVHTRDFHQPADALASVEEITFRGATQMLVLAHDGARFLSRVTSADSPWKVGDEVKLDIDSRATTAITPD
jgi:ABC-type Fe3+/spermidine/putrescine transport system ATPase subunit